MKCVKTKHTLTFEWVYSDLGLGIPAIFVTEYFNVFLSTRTLISPQEHQIRAKKWIASISAECLSEWLLRLFLEYDNDYILWFFTAVKMIIFRWKIEIFFLNIAQTIDRGYTLEPPVLTNTHDLCFRAKNKKNEYPCKPQFYFIKVGCKWVYIARTCYHDA